MLQARIMVRSHGMRDVKDRKRLGERFIVYEDQSGGPISWFEIQHMVIKSYDAMGRERQRVVRRAMIGS